MDIEAIQYQINDLPSTYKRSGQTYEWLTNSLVAGLYRYANSVEGTLSQASFATAIGKWLDAWGLLMGGITRQPGQNDAAFQNFIQQVVSSGKGPPLAISQYIQLTYGLNNSVSENFPNVGWFLKFAATFPKSLYNALAITIGAVRPAGIPFSPFYILGGGLYVGTLNYVGAKRVTGSYFGLPLVPYAFTIPSSTNNAVNTLPVLYLEDPFLNPTLPAPVPQTLAVSTTSQQLGSAAYTNFTLTTSSPNGSLAGTIGDKAYNTSTRVLYVCSTTGTTTTAVWEPVTGSVTS